MNRKSQTHTNNKPRSEEKVLGFNSFVSFVKTDRVNCSSLPLERVCDPIQKNSSLELMDQIESNNYDLSLREKQRLLLSRLNEFQIIIITIWITDNVKQTSEVILK